MIKFKCRKYDLGFFLYAIEVSYNIYICNAIKTTCLQLYLKTTWSIKYNSCIHFCLCLRKRVCGQSHISHFPLYNTMFFHLFFEALKEFHAHTKQPKTYLPTRLNNINPFLQRTPLFAEFCIVIIFKNRCFVLRSSNTPYIFIDKHDNNSQS